MKKAKQETGIIILAAGASTRMGQAKQLLRIAGESLIQRVVNTAFGYLIRTSLWWFWAQIGNKLNRNFKARR